MNWLREKKEALVTWIMVTPAEAKIIGKNQMELAMDIECCLP